MQGGRLKKREKGRGRGREIESAYIGNRMVRMLGVLMGSRRIPAYVGKRTLMMFEVEHFI